MGQNSNNPAKGKMGGASGNDPRGNPRQAASSPGSAGKAMPPTDVIRRRDGVGDVKGGR